MLAKIIERPKNNTSPFPSPLQALCFYCDNIQNQWQYSSSTERMSRPLKVPLAPTSSMLILVVSSTKPYDKAELGTEIRLQPS